MIIESSHALPRTISSEITGDSIAAIKGVRPHRIFSLVEGRPFDRCVVVPIPSYKGGGGLTLLETSVVLAACRIVAPKRVFEFGTFRGTTTLCLALNTSSDCEVLTLDLDALASAGELHLADAPIAAEHFARERLDFIDSPVGAKVRTLAGNSRTFDFTPWFGKVDFVFVDGGHDLPTVISDTENAFRLMRSGGPTCILWHDYKNADYPEITDYLGNLAQKMPLIHVEDTMLCAWFRGFEFAG